MGNGTVTYDERRGTWRVQVTVNGRRVFRRAATLPLALSIRDQLVAARPRPVSERLRDGSTKLDVSGLSEDQIRTLLDLIEHWTVRPPREVS